MFSSNTSIKLADKHIVTKFSITCHTCGHREEDERKMGNVSTQSYADWLEYNGWTLDENEKPKCNKCKSK